MSSEEDRSPEPADDRPVYRVGYARSSDPLALDPLSPITPAVTYADDDRARRGRPVPSEAPGTTD